MIGIPCSTCHGSGIMAGQICPMCEGTGQQYDPGREFTYELGPIVLTGLQTLQAQSVQVLNRSFRWMMALAASTFPFAAQISDSRDQRPFSNQPVHSSNLFGTAQNPMPLLTPFVFNKQANILAAITDLGGGAGVVGVTNGSPTVTFVSGTPFFTGSGLGITWVGATITINGVNYTISAVTNQNTITLAGNYAGATNAGVAYNVGNTVRIAFKGVELSDGSN